MEIKQHVPKGGMCTNCIKRMEDCSSLPFNLMYPISKDENGICYVRCSHHEAYIKNKLKEQ